MASKDFEGLNTNSQLTGNIAVLEENIPGKAKDIAKCGVITIRKETSVYEAAGKLIENNISGLPVIDDTGLVGIISEKDLLKLLYNTEFLSGCIEDYMTGKPVCFEDEDSLADICDCLMNNNFRRVPILHQGKLAGIISRADIIKACLCKFKPQGSVEKSSKSKGFPMAKDVMKCGLLTVTSQTSIYDAMEIIAARNITGLPVVDDYMNLVGSVSEKEMLKLFCHSKAELGKVGDFMSK